MVYNEAALHILLPLHLSYNQAYLSKTCRRKYVVVGICKRQTR